MGCVSAKPVDDSARRAKESREDALIAQHQVDLPPGLHPANERAFRLRTIREKQISGEQVDGRTEGQRRRAERILILGAGPSGVAAAYYLEQNGFQHVTVLETSDYVGGKCHTVFHGGHQFELGAVEVTQYYEHVLDLMRKSDVGTSAAQKFLLCDHHEGKDYPLTHLAPGVFDKLATLGHAVRYGRQLGHVYRTEIEDIGFGRMDKIDLGCSFAEWLRKRHMDHLIETFHVPITVYGYGEVADIPAPYALKYMNHNNYGALLNIGSREALGLTPSWPRRVKGGFQSVFEKVASTLGDVRLNVQIESLQRRTEAQMREEGGQRPIKVVYRVKGDSSGKQVVEEYDKVIVAFPQLLKNMEGWLDLSEEETSLFRHVIYEYYYVSLVRSENPDVFTDSIHCMLLRNGKFNLPEDNGIFCVVRLYSESNIWTVYSYSRKPTTVQQIQEGMRRQFDRMKKGEVEIIQTAEWQYFPHVSADAIKSGFYEKLEALQGARGTFFTGGLLAFETVEHTVRYSWDLVCNRGFFVEDAAQARGFERPERHHFLHLHRHHRHAPSEVEARLAEQEEDREAHHKGVKPASRIDLHAGVAGADAAEEKQQEDEEELEDDGEEPQPQQQHKKADTMFSGASGLMEIHTAT